MRPGVFLATAALCLLPVAVLPQGASSLPDPALENGLEVGPAAGPVSKLPAARVETIEVVISDQMAGLGIPGLYGLGMGVDEREGCREAWHGAGQEGVSKVLYFRPDGGPVVAVLTNLQELGPRLLELARNIAHLVVADPDGVK